jgi:hypothetical protein
LKDSERKIQAIEKLYEDNGKLLKELCYKADMIYRIYFPGKDLAMTGVDIVYGIIESMLTGSRSWNLEDYPDAYNQVKYYFSSEFTNIKSKESKIINSIDIDSNKKSDIDIIYNDRKLITDENREEDETQEMFKKCLSYVKEDGNQLEEAVFEGVYNGKTNAEIAEENCTEVRYVENVRRKLKRKLQKKFPDYRIKK